MNKEQFYLRCAEIMGAEHEMIIRSPYWRRTRWTDRKPGNGRFENIGIIRVFGSTVHVAINNPIVLTAIYDSWDEALAALEIIFKKDT